MGYYVNILMPTLLCCALLAIEAIVSELENPFSYDANDIDVQEMLTTFEKEFMAMLELAGDSVARDSFVWLPVPKFMQQQSFKPWLAYLAFKPSVQHLQLPRYNDSTDRGMETTRIRRCVRGP